VGQARARLIGGAASDAQVASSIVALVFDSSDLCSGVLVAPKIVLTAGSCLDPTTRGVADQDAVTKATHVLIDADDVSDASSAQLVPAVATVVHPQFDRNTFAHDVGVVTLATPVASRNFPVLHTDPGAGLSSAEVALWGFGIALGDGSALDPGSVGRKRQLTKTVGDCAALDGRSNADYVCFDQTSGGGICAGDTGGPTLLTDGPDELLIGLHALGDAQCASFGVDARVSAELDFLGSKVCAADGACVPICGTLPLPQDPDCPTTGPESDAGSPDAPEPVLDGAFGDAAEDAASDDASDDAQSSDAPVHSDAPSEEASDPTPPPPDDGCGCRVALQRGSSLQGVGCFTAGIWLLRRARRRELRRRRPAHRSA
jgi:hypothetical protein